MLAHESRCQGTLHVLLVEDDEGHAQLINRAFAEAEKSFHVSLARNISQATVRAREDPPDVAIVDFVLPDGRGVDFIPAGEDGFPVVILTAHGNEREAVESLKAGALNYVVKSPAAFSEIVHVAQSAIREWRLISERRAAEESLRQSEERFRNLIEGSIQGILIGREWKPLFANQAYADILGFDSPEEVLALESDEILFAEHERERLWGYHRARLEGRAAPTHYEFEAVRKDGSIVSLQNVVRLVTWEGEPAVQSVVTDISDRKRAERALEYRAELEELIINISARFINLASHEIDPAIVEALKEMGQFCAVDRAYVVLFSGDQGGRLHTPYEWCAEGIGTLESSFRGGSCSALPWVMEQHRRGDIIYVRSASDLSAQAKAERDWLEATGIRSTISLPLMTEGEVMGFLGFDSVREEKQWNEDVISILTVVGESFANAIARKRSEEVLRDSEQRFKDFADIAADWFWEMGPDLRFSYLSERYQQIVGVPPAEHIGRSSGEIFADQADDRERWLEFMKRLEERRPFDVEISWVRNDSSSRVVRYIGRPRYAEDGTFLGYRGVGRDVTEAHRLTEQIQHQATHDALTGLVNRREFERRLDRAVVRAQTQGSYYVLGYLDLDRFKIVNDIAGHAAGDVLLKRLATLLNHRVRGRDTLARLGGDEFSLLLENCPLEKALEIAEGMLREVRSFSLPWEGRTFGVGISIGLVSINAGCESVGKALAQADQACYTAKRQGRNRVHVYRMEDRELARRQSDIQRVADLRDALQNDQFRLYSQPIVSLHDHTVQISHYELLLRLQEPSGEVVSPHAFIPAAERYGVMGPIDRWVIQRAFADSGPLLEASPGAAIAINLSGNSLNDDSLLAFVIEQFKGSSVPPARVCFEITETAAINNFDRATRFMRAMKAEGCQFALDDFGSGVSSFKYLKHLPVDYLKIDGSFVREIDREPVDRAMVAAIHEVGRIMGIRTIAECADTAAVVEELGTLGVELVQGDAVGPAVPLEVAVGRARG